MLRRRGAPYPKRHRRGSPCTPSKRSRIMVDGLGVHAIAAMQEAVEVFEIGEPAEAVEIVGQLRRFLDPVEAAEGADETLPGEDRSASSSRSRPSSAGFTAYLNTSQNPAA